jgi:hypothetical protein
MRTRPAAEFFGIRQGNGSGIAKEALAGSPAVFAARIHIQISTIRGRERGVVTIRMCQY